MKPRKKKPWRYIKLDDKWIEVEALDAGMLAEDFARHAAPKFMEVITTYRPRPGDCITFTYDIHVEGE